MVAPSGRTSATAHDGPIDACACEGNAYVASNVLLRPPERSVDVSHAGRVHRLLWHLRHERVKLPLIGQGVRRRPRHAQLFGGANRLFFALSHDPDETPVADDRHQPRHPAHRAIVNVQHGRAADAVHGPHKWSEHAAVQHPVEPEIVDEAFAARELGEEIGPWDGLPDGGGLRGPRPRRLSGRLLTEGLGGQFGVRHGPGRIVTDADDSVSRLQFVDRHAAAARRRARGGSAEPRPRSAGAGTRRPGASCSRSFPPHRGSARCRP